MLFDLDYVGSTQDVRDDASKMLRLPNSQLVLYQMIQLSLSQLILIQGTGRECSPTSRHVAYTLVKAT